MNKPELSHARLEASLDARIERHFDILDTDPDVLKQLLADKRSENTRGAYERDVNDFLKTMTGKSACPDSVLEFLHLEERPAVSVVLKYKAKLIDKGVKEATVNRWLAAVKFSIWSSALLTRKLQLLFSCSRLHFIPFVTFVSSPS